MIIEGFIQGVIVHGGISIADKIKKKSLEKKVQNDSKNTKDYYKLIRIYSKSADNYEQIINTSYKLLKIYPESIFAWLHICIYSTLRQLKGIQNIKDIKKDLELEELLSLFQKSSEIAEKTKEEELTFFEFAPYFYLAGFVNKIAGEDEKAEYYKTCGLAIDKKMERLLKY